MAKILRHLNLNPNQFLSMCVIASCDYLPNIKTIGIHNAQHIVNGIDFLAFLEQHKQAPPQYRHVFLQAIAVFNHQFIYDIKTLRVLPLQPWREGRVDEKENIIYILTKSEAL
jgi:5'-3' exonuclease